MIKCNSCDKEAVYIVDGNSLCKEHRSKSKIQGLDSEQEGITAGERMAGG